MFLYNVTITIDLDVHEDWVRWMRETHIPEVMATGMFVSNRMSRLLPLTLIGQMILFETLFALLYDELHRLAHAHVARARGAMTWNTTTLLHEAYLGFAQREGLRFPDENRFLGYAARAMRGLVIDAIRSRYTEKRGGEVTFVPVAEAMLASVGSPEEVERLGDALADLARLEAALAELVDLAFFCGFTFAEVAAMRGVTERTVQRDWAKARLLLHGALGKS